MEYKNLNAELLQTDEANLFFDIIFGIPTAQALHIAHELNLFNLINQQRSLSLKEISEILQTERRPTQALLSMCASLNLIQLNKKNKFELTITAKKYLLRESPYYLGGFLDLTLKNEIYSLKNFRKPLIESSSQIYEGKELFQTNEERIELTKFFTRCMHGKSITMASFWPNKINLSQHQCLLDVGGGSGAHSIGAISRWPNLKAIVYDRPFVTEVALDYIEKCGLEGLIQTYIGDMWEEPFPFADVHFYCDIFHDWSIEHCKFLAKKSYDALPKNGRIIIHEMLFNEEKTGPLSVASYNILMLLWTEDGQQLSGNEIMSLLEESGFINVRIIPTGFGDWSLIEGQKK